MFVVRRAPVLARMFTSSKTTIEDAVKNKGKADEDIYFNRKDKELLKKLVDKLDHSTEDLSNPEVAKKSREALVTVLKKHSIRPSEALIEDLVNWKAGGV
jgi:hypothetical protein